MRNEEPHACHSQNRVSQWPNWGSLFPFELVQIKLKVSSSLSRATFPMFRRQTGGDEAITRGLLSCPASRGECVPRHVSKAQPRAMVANTDGVSECPVGTERGSWVGAAACSPAPLPLLPQQGLVPTDPSWAPIPQTLPCIPSLSPQSPGPMPPEVPLPVHLEFWFLFPHLSPPA